MRYSWCDGIVIDEGFREQTCEMRDNCAFYAEDLFRRFERYQLEETPLQNSPGVECGWFLNKKINDPASSYKTPFD